MGRPVGVIGNAGQLPCTLPSRIAGNLDQNPGPLEEQHIWDLCSISTLLTPSILAHTGVSTQPTWNPDDVSP